MSICQTHGRIVICGEHAVVYGQPALVGSINLGLTAAVTSHPQKPTNNYLHLILTTFASNFNVDTSTLSLSINGNLPPKRGLGSSTTAAAASLQALAHHFHLRLTKDQLFNLVMAIEHQIYPTVSGMDQTAVVYGGLHIFQNTPHGLSKTSLKSTPLQQQQFWLIDSGQATESTAEMVQQVRDKKQETRNKKVEEIGKVTRRFISKIKTGQFSPTLIKENQSLLDELGVVGDKARNMVQQIEAIGGVTKITGAGGIKSGSGMLLCYHPDPSRLQHLVSKHLWSSIPVSFT